MPILPKKKLNQALRGEATKRLLEEIDSISSFVALERFFRKFFSEQEKDTILRRVAVEIQILNGRKYRDIKEGLEVSGNMISRIKRAIQGRDYIARRSVFHEVAPSPRETKKRRLFPRYYK